ncbi:hypothetical protein GCM10008094_12600 [Aidingimonas halophila]|nr:hypothetical protein GCM10008094_12600 [Aidingimonas halophila]
MRFQHLVWKPGAIDIGGAWGAIQEWCEWHPIKVRCQYGASDSNSSDLASRMTSSQAACWAN